MTRKTNNRSRGEHTEIIFFFGGVPTPTCDIDNFTINNNSKLLTYKAIGSVIPRFDVSYGDGYSFDIKCGKSGSENERIWQKILDAITVGKESPQCDILVTIRDVNGIGIESITYTDCVVQFPDKTVAGPDEQITETLKVAAADRKVHTLIPPKKIL